MQNTLKLMSIGSFVIIFEKENDLMIDQLSRNEFRGRRGTKKLNKLLINNGSILS